MIAKAQSSRDIVCRRCRSLAPFAIASGQWSAFKRAKQARAVCVPGFAVIRIVRSAEGFRLYGRYLRARGGGKIT